MKIRNYYELTKPRLIYGNLVTTLGSYLYGLDMSFEFIRAFLVCAGVGLVMASGCVFNNLIDQDIDKLMERTKDRASAKGEIDTDSGIVFGTILLGIGTLLLTLAHAQVALLVVLFGLFTYAGLYSLWYKRNSIHGTFVGAIAGATPPLAGYAAATGTIDMQGVILFLILVSWQMPHAFAIAMYRKEDYIAAKIPVLPAITDGPMTKKWMSFCAATFLVFALLPYATGHANVIYGSIALAMSSYLLYLIEFKLPSSDEKSIGRKIFRTSLLAIISIFIALPFTVIK